MNDNINKAFDKLIQAHLTMLFAALKLCGVIDWSWVWVLCPVWIPLLFIALFGIISIFLGDGGDDDVKIA